jgi:peroxiredoxin
MSVAIAPELKVSKWFNTDKDITLADLRGKVVVIEAFQMLCPGCVSHSLPMAQKIHQMFPRDQVAVIGLHTVFEHHGAMTPVSLEAFLYEYRLTFPVGVDQAGQGNMPVTMQAYQMQGTPSLILIDKQGMLRANHFGQVSELQIGAEIATLTGEGITSLMPEDVDGKCDENGCPIP